MFVAAWRILLITMNFGSVLILLNNLRKYRNRWATGTRDYWVTLMLWSISGILVPLDSLASHAGYSPRLIFLSIATLAAPIALRDKRRLHKREDDGREAIWPGPKNAMTPKKSSTD